MFSVQSISSSSGSLATFGCEVSVIGTNGATLGRSTLRVEQQLVFGAASLDGASQTFVYEYEVRVQKYCQRNILKDTGGWKNCRQDLLGER